MNQLALPEAGVSQPIEVQLRDNTMLEVLDRVAAKISVARNHAELLDAWRINKEALEIIELRLRLAELNGARDEVFHELSLWRARALEIDHDFKVVLADRYDEAQAAGEVAGSHEGRPRRSGVERLPPAADLGLTRKQIHEARQHRDAERADPGVVKKLLAATLDADEEPTPAAIRATIKKVAQEAGPVVDGKKRSVSLVEWAEMHPDLRKTVCDPLLFGSDQRLLKQTGTGIEWAQWSWNPVTGCKHDCPYCYARDIAERYSKAFPEGFDPALWPDRLAAPTNTKVPKQAVEDTRFRNIFTCSMADLFGRWVPPEWINAVLDTMRAAPQWNFLCLTKFPKRMAEFDIPENAWMGTTVDLQARVKNAEDAFEKVKCGVKWLSLEPLIEPLKFERLELFDWIVVGGASPSKETPAWRPPTDWIEDIKAQRDAAERKRSARIGIYEKTNLWGNRTTEMPTKDGVRFPIKCDLTEAPAVFHYLGKRGVS